MDIKELLNWINLQLNMFDSDREEAEENDSEVEYAYADGAYEAYEMMYNKLQEMS